MSKITEDDLRTRTDIEIMALIDQREEEFQELVDAAELLSQAMDDHWNHVACRYPDKEIVAAQQIVKSFLSPPPDPHKVLADRLRAIENDICISQELEKNLREIAADIEKLGVSDE